MIDNEKITILIEKAYDEGYKNGYAAGKEEGRLEILREELARIERKIGDHYDKI